MCALPDMQYIALFSLLYLIHSYVYEGSQLANERNALTVLSELFARVHADDCKVQFAHLCSTSTSGSAPDSRAQLHHHLWNLHSGDQEIVACTCS